MPNVRRTGAAFEIAATNYLREKVGNAERSPRNGRDDQGDLWFLSGDLPVVIEAKNERRINLSAYVTEAKDEARNWHRARPGLGRPTPVALIKRRNHSIGKSYVVMELDEFIELVNRT